MQDDPVIQALSIQARACDSMGSPFSATLLAKAADDLVRDEGLRRLFAAWDGAGLRALVTDAAALRFLGALHERVLSGAAPELAACYPGATGAGDPLLATCHPHGAWVEWRA